MGHDRELDEHTVPLEALDASADHPLIGSLVGGLLRAQIEGGASSGELRIEWRRVGGALSLGVARTAPGRVPDPPPTDDARGAFLVVEDDAGAARALARAIGQFSAVVIAGSSAEALAAWSGEPRRWIGLVVDVGLPDGSGLDFVAEVRATDPRVPVLVLTGDLDPRRTNRAQLLDAEFAFKPVQYDNLVSFAERACARGLLEEQAIAAVIARLGREHGLTPREMEVLAIVVRNEGSPRGLAAEALGLSHHTVKTYFGKILKKTGVRNLADLTQSVLREAWLATRPR